MPFRQGRTVTTGSRIVPWAKLGICCLQELRNAVQILPCPNAKARQNRETLNFSSEAGKDVSRDCTTKKKDKAWIFSSDMGRDIFGDCNICVFVALNLLPIRWPLGTTLADSCWGDSPPLRLSRARLSLTLTLPVSLPRHWGRYPRHIRLRSH